MTRIYIGLKNTVIKIDGRFLRQELFALNKQFAR